MKLLISIASYLLKDIFWRWFEQPGNVLTRFIIAYILVLPSLALLCVFVQMTERLEDRLKRNGVDILFITEMISGTSDDLVAHQRHPRFAPLGLYGQMFQLMQLYGSAQTTFGKTARIVAYPDSAISYLDGIICPDFSVIFLSDSLPLDMPVRTRIDNHFYTAYVRRPNEMLARLFQENAILLPEGMLPRLESRGFMRITLFKTRQMSTLRVLPQSVQLTAELDKTQIHIRSSLKLLDELDRLKESQLYWQFGLATTAGSVLALVLGTIAILEYHQRAYVIALLRSFGIQSWLVLGMQLLESALLVNAAAIAAYLTLDYIQYVPYTLSGSDLLTAGLPLEQMFKEVLVIFSSINVSVLLSTLPTMHALRKDIGTILC